MVYVYGVSVVCAFTSIKVAQSSKCSIVIHFQLTPIDAYSSVRCAFSLSLSLSLSLSHLPFTCDQCSHPHENHVSHIHRLMHPVSHSHTLMLRITTLDSLRLLFYFSLFLSPLSSISSPSSAESLGMRTSQTFCRPRSELDQSLSRLSLSLSLQTSAHLLENQFPFKFVHEM